MDGPAHYDRYVAPFVRAYTDATLDGLAGIAPRRAMDHGAGTGAVTAALHRNFRRAHVTAVEPNSAMLDRLTHKPDVDPARLAAVMGTIADVDPAARFDTICSQLVLMFVRDVDAELARLRFLATPDARLVISVLRGPRDVVPFTAYWEAAATVVPGLLDPADYPHFRFADGACLVRAVECAGWARPELTPVTSWREVDADELWAWIHGALAMLDTTGCALDRPTGDLAEQIRSAFLDTVTEYTIDADRYRLPLHGWRVTSHAR